MLSGPRQARLDAFRREYTLTPLRALVAQRFFPPTDGRVLYASQLSCQTWSYLPLRTTFRILRRPFLSWRFLRMLYLEIPFLAPKLFVRARSMRYRSRTRAGIRICSATFYFLLLPLTRSVGWAGYAPRLLRRPDFRTPPQADKVLIGARSCWPSEARASLRGIGPETIPGGVSRNALSCSMRTALRPENSSRPIDYGAP